MGELEGDLQKLAPIFANSVSPKNLKARIYDLPEAGPDAKALPAEVILVVDGCAVITPEGRILLEVLRDIQGAGAAEISVSQQLSALSSSSATRARWQAEWLRKQFESSVSPPVLGAALFLLVNGSIGERNAFMMPSDPDRDRELGAVVLPLISRFSKALGGNAPTSISGVRQHWAFTQVSRLMGRDVAREKAGDGTAVFVRADREGQLLKSLEARLSRAAPEHQRLLALRDFTDGYRKARGPLAALGLMHEDPSRTRRILDRLADVGGTSR